MKDLFEKYGIDYDCESLEKLDVFKRLLKEYGSKFNITAVLEDEGIKVKHFLDSVLYVDKFSTNAEVIEIGSGGGFPSIPNKILRKDLNFTLVEATGKKCEFLKTAVKELGLKGITVLNARAEELGQDKKYREKYDYAIARAVAGMNVLSELCLPLVKINGKFVAYKGNAEEELNAAKSAIKTLGGKVNEVYSFELPCGAGKREIIEVEKVFSTDIKYPRQYAKIKKSPL